MLPMCEECNAPLVFTGEHIWLNNGDIVQKRDERHRIVFIESENLDPLFKGIEGIIGMPVENIIINCVRRSLLTYMRLFVSDEVREKVRKGEISLKAMDDGFRNMAIPSGFGKYEFMDMRYEGDDEDHFTVSVSEPYSLPMCVAGHNAAMEAILGYDHGVVYSELEPDLYSITAFPSPHPEEFKGRLTMELYNHRDGDFELERCATCGGPKPLSWHRWYLNRGIILNERNRRRLTLMSPSEMDPIFVELEEELGETIPGVVVEAQRRFTRTGFYSMDDVATEGDFRTELALRGLGNLRELEIRRRGVHMYIENACLPLLVVGMMQGVFEMAFDLDSNVEWVFSEESNLEVQITPTGVVKEAVEPTPPRTKV